jgi:hypothetical protein
MDRLQLIPANRPGLAVARWRVRSHSDDLDLEIFQEALVEPGLLEAIFLSVVLLRSGQPLDDAAEAMGYSNLVTTLVCAGPIATVPHPVSGHT